MNRLYFSIFGGNVYEASDDETLDAFQIPLRKRPISSCKKCHGRFYTGYDSVKRHYIMCSYCAKRCIDIEKVISEKNAKK